MDQAVKDGKITQAQKTAIIAKLQELRQTRLDWEQQKSQTPVERQRAREQRQNDLQSWASQNGLDLQTLSALLHPSHPGFGRGHHMLSPK